MNYDASQMKARKIGEMISAFTQIAAVVADCLPPKRRQTLNLERITHLLFMAFDGFSLNAHFAPDRPCDLAMVRMVAELLIGPTPRKAV